VWRWQTEGRPLSIQQFALNEPLLALRSSVLRAVGERAQLQRHLLQASRMARKAGHLAGAASVLHEVREERQRQPRFLILSVLHEVREGDRESRIFLFSVCCMR